MSAIQNTNNHDDHQNNQYADAIDSSPLAQLEAELSLVDMDSPYGARAVARVQHAITAHQNQAAGLRRSKQQRAIAHIEECAKSAAKKPVNAVPAKHRRRSLVRSPIPWTRQAPPFELARRGAFFGMDRLHPMDAVHVLCIGGTGVGKTISTVEPVLRAMLRYPLPTASGDKSTAMFVVDPKRELLSVVTTTLAASGQLHRLRHLGEDDTLPPVAFFEVDDGLSPRDKLARLGTVLGTEDLAVDNMKYWQEAGLLVLLQFMQLEQDYRLCTGSSLFEELAKRLQLPVEPYTGFWNRLSVFVSRSRGKRSEFELMSKMLEAVLNDAGMGRHADATVMSSFLGNDDNNIQWHYRAQSLHPMTSLLGDPDIAAVVDFDPFPDGSRTTTDVRAALDDGLVLLYQPEPCANAEMAARAIKTKVFEAVKSRNDMERPVGIVIDEFQKFISCDPVTGDATFLDTARAYRANCVLATQSIGALLLALGSTAQARSAVDAIVANTPTKFFFGSKDRQTTQELRALIPALPGGQHVLDIRTLAQLQPGEAYWSLANGQWGRGCAEREDLL
jgi:hypothetical protein